jgi:glycerol-3-phosphate dehydrogenase subunit B
MPSADVVVIGAGLSGLTAAIELAERRARVHLVAKGMATTHWAHGGLDVAAPPGAATSAAGAEALRAVDGHPYGLLHDDIEPAVTAHMARLVAAGLPYRGDLASPLRPFPTPIGGLRPAAILPAAQAAALDPWDADEGLVLLGVERFRDAWPEFAARNLEGRWPDGPARIRPAEARLPGLEGMHNLNALTLARRFDDDTWRATALDALRAAIPATGHWRIGVPAILGLDRHADVLAAATDRLGHPVFEIPTLPPSVPGLRLFEALRRRALTLGVAMQIGFGVEGLIRDGGHVAAVESHGAARSLRILAGEVVLATGGIAGGGLRGERDGRVLDVVAGLPVVAPQRAGWLAGDLYGADGVPLETAGIRVDAQLRPVDATGKPVLDNLRVVGSALAGMRYLSERCGDGVALASAHRAARLWAESRHPARAGEAVAS